MGVFREWLALNEVRYGNYCGPGPKMDVSCAKLADGSPLPPPINRVDAVCQAHDVAYCRCGAGWQHGLIGRAGSPCSREADEVLRRDIESIAASLPRGERLAASVILNYFRSHGRVQKTIHRDSQPRS